MFKRKNYFALGAVVLVTLAIFSLPPLAASRLKLVVGSLFLPLFGLANAAQQASVSAADAILPRRELLKKVGSLEQENQQLKILQLQSSEIARENDQLRTQIGWQKQTPWKLKLANIVMRDPANWWRTAQIDLGSRDGIQTNMPALSPEGFLIGKISSVGLYKSRIILIGDPNCRVSARVENPARDTGIISARDPLDNSLVQLTYLSGNANLKPGQNVVTSGLGGVFPQGIPIGKVAEGAQQVEFGLYTEARVKLNANLGALEQVWILFP